MDHTLTRAHPATVRAAIAHCVLGASPLEPRDRNARDPSRLGAITLHAHQLEAVARLRALTAAEGGALLADAVGLGKTYVALALVGDVRRPLVVAPAALRDMWRNAMRTAGLSAPVLSFEALSRRGPRGSHARRSAPENSHDLVVVDEAHHARNPATRRFRALAELAVGARVVLLSATPIHNRRADLASLLSLFLGRRAFSLDDDELSRFVVRRAVTDVEAAAEARSDRRIPVVEAPVVLTLPADDAVPEQILSLPPPVPPRDGDDGGALVAHSLVRQWASSDAALRAALRRRLARALALESSLDRGVHPSLGELRAWTSDGDSQQLAFAELLAPESERLADAGALRMAVAAHAAALRAMLAGLDRRDARDDCRATLLGDVCRRHAGESIVAFASYSETVGALFRRLRGVVPTAALTATGAVVAGGRLTRREVLTRFAPLAHGAPLPRAAERVQLLLTTDLLSEGVSLSDASVVVHLDLPWTPARLEQRVGRAARLGSPHDRVAVYSLAPPASAEAALRIERRLREKLRAAGRVIGIAGAILPGACVTMCAPSDATSASESAEETRRVLERWRSGGEASERVVAQLRCGLSGFLAACRVESAPTDGATDSSPATVLLASSRERGATDDVRVVRSAVVAAGAGEMAQVSVDALAGALAAVRRWSERRSVLEATGIADGASIGARRRVIGRIAAIARRLPAHRRVALAALAQSARRAALAPCGAGGEWVLAELARADLPDEAWLRAVRAFGESATIGRAASSREGGLAIVALLLLQP